MRKLKIVRKWQRSSLYKKSLILFSLVMVVLSSIFLIYVYNSMVLYERNLVDNYIAYLATSGNLSKDIADNLFPISKYEKNNASISEGVKKLYKSDNLKIRKNSKESTSDVFAYDLYNNDKLISTVSIKSKNKYKRMAILTIDEWEIVESKNYFAEGLYSYEISIPKNYQLYVNNNLVSDDDKTSEGDVAGLERLTEYVEIMPSKTYKINNLVYEPQIKILDENGKETKYEVKDNKIVVTKGFQEIETLEAAQKYLQNDFDVLKLAEDWSLFLSRDLSGSYYGFSNLSTYLINDSYMYDMAYKWAHGVDITFVSKHTLKNPPFTNESVRNFIIYNENAFSCEAYLEKNMTVSGKLQVDKMHDRLYFIYYDGGYKLVNMEAIND